MMMRKQRRGGEVMGSEEARQLAEEGLQSKALRKIGYDGLARAVLSLSDELADALSKLKLRIAERDDERRFRRVAEAELEQAKADRYEIGRIVGGDVEAWENHCKLLANKLADAEAELEQAKQALEQVKNERELLREEGDVILAQLRKDQAELEQAKQERDENRRN